MANVPLPDNMYTNPFYKPNDNDEQREKMKQIVNNFIDTQLTKRQKQVILLHLEGKKDSEIADVLGISKVSVGKKISAVNKKIDNFKKIFENVTL